MWLVLFVGGLVLLFGLSVGFVGCGDLMSFGSCVVQWILVVLFGDLVF